jgi:two-component system response regulator YesN
MLKVLAVDDEAPIRQWIRFCISKIPGFSCAIASGAEEGIRKYREERPEIVITDVEMPCMDGLEMLQNIRELGGNVYSIVLTSHENFDYARTALKIGSAEYILKTELTEEGLRELLNKAKRAVEKEKNIQAMLPPQIKKLDEQMGPIEQIGRTISYMEQHYGEKLSLNYMADMVSFSPEHFSRLFRRETGETYINYLNNIRMKQAVILLETTDKKVYEVAEETGFSSLNYFSTLFKKKFGISPYNYQVGFQRGRNVQAGEES